MTKIALLSAGLAAMIVPLLPATPAQALFKTFVASTGGGAACTRAAPCADFQAAHNVTDANGEINCLDSGPFLSISITKSITIDCAGTAATANNIIVNGAGIVVRIRNLTFGTVAAGVAVSINFVNGAALIVENCIIQKYNFASGLGINFVPSSGAQLVVTDTTINNNGTATLVGGGIIIKPTGSGTIDVVLDRVRVENNITGIRVDGSSSTGVIQATVRDSVVSGNKSGSGVTAVTTAGQATTTVFIDRTALVSNGTGVLSDGAAAAVLLSASTIQANGVALSSANGGALFSYKDNKINNNGTPGAAPTVVPTN